MTTERDTAGFEPPHSSSPTGSLLDELQLYGYRPFQDEPDPRPLPEARTVAGAVADIFDAFVATLGDTRLEPDLEDLLWSTVNLFHRAVARIERELDDNEQAQRRGQKEQDGSEIRSVELERLTAEGMTLIERRNSMEFFRDQAAEQFERHTGSTWRPRGGSMVNHRALTSAMIDCQRFPRRQAAGRERGSTPRRSQGRLHRRARLQRCQRNLGHGSTRFTPSIPTWCCCMAAHRRARSSSPPNGRTARKVPQIAFKPDWTKHAKAAPFKRNDQMLEVLPIGVIIFPGSGIQDNLADKAKKLGIPVWKFGEGGA